MTTLQMYLAGKVTKKLARSIAMQQYSELTKDWNLMGSRNARKKAEILTSYLKNRDMTTLDALDKIYQRGNKLISLLPSQVGVKLSNGQFAIIESGRLYRLEDMRRMMRSLDVASGGYDNHTYEDLWTNATNRQRAEIIHALKDVDWDVVWNEKYSEESGLLAQSELDSINNILSGIFPELQFSSVRFPQVFKQRHNVR